MARHLFQVAVTAPSPDHGQPSSGLTRSQTILVCTLVVGTLVVLLVCFGVYLMWSEWRVWRVSLKKLTWLTDRRHVFTSVGGKLDPRLELELRQVLQAMVVERPLYPQDCKAQQYAHSKHDGHLSTVAQRASATRHGELRRPPPVAVSKPPANHTAHAVLASPYSSTGAMQSPGPESFLTGAIHKSRMPHTPLVSNSPVVFPLSQSARYLPFSSQGESPLYYSPKRMRGHGAVGQSSPGHFPFSTPLEPVHRGGRQPLKVRAIDVAASGTGLAASRVMLAAGTTPSEDQSSWDSSTCPQNAEHRVSPVIISDVTLRDPDASRVPVMSSASRAHRRGSQSHSQHSQVPPSSSRGRDHHRVPVEHRSSSRTSINDTDVAPCRSRGSASHRQDLYIDVRKALHRAMSANGVQIDGREDIEAAFRAHSHRRTGAGSRPAAGAKRMVRSSADSSPGRVCMATQLQGRKLHTPAATPINSVIVGSAPPLGASLEAAYASRQISSRHANVLSASDVGARVREAGAGASVLCPEQPSSGSSSSSIQAARAAAKAGSVVKTSGLRVRSTIVQPLTPPRSAAQTRCIPSPSVDWQAALAAANNTPQRFPRTPPELSLTPDLSPSKLSASSEDFIALPMPPRPQGLPRVR